MRALRRIATPASIGLVLAGCSYPFEDFLPQSSAVTSTDSGPEVRPAPADAGPVGAATDTRPGDTFVEDTFVEDTFVEDTFVEDTFVADTFVADTSVADTAPPCVCVKPAGTNCKEWSPPGCGKD